VKVNFTLLRYSAAGSTLIAGILHLSLVANSIERNLTTGILFLIGGLAQLFWVVPTIRGWNKVWYYVGIGGTMAFILIWAITRFSGNPINGRGGSIGETAIVIEVFQIAFIALSIIILYKDPNLRNKTLSIKY
jgi:VIT1/CCC1 family predicted Fe2+/Mn2+ transporter